MTREEAIERLEDTFEGWERWNPHNDSPASKLSEALGMAISALREQEERSKGCGHCLSEINKDMMLAHGFAHCTDCGRRLEEA